MRPGTATRRTTSASSAVVHPLSTGMPGAAASPDRSGNIEEGCRYRRGGPYLAGSGQAVHAARVVAVVDAVGNPGRFGEEGCGLVCVLGHGHGYHNLTATGYRRSAGPDALRVRGAPIRHKERTAQAQRRRAAPATEARSRRRTEAPGRPAESEGSTRTRPWARPVNPDATRNHPNDRARPRNPPPRRTPGRRPGARPDRPDGPRRTTRRPKIVQGRREGAQRRSSSPRSVHSHGAIVVRPGGNAVSRQTAYLSALPDWSRSDRPAEVAEAIVW